MYKYQCLLLLTEISQTSIEIKTWMTNCIYINLIYVVSHPCPDFNSTLSKLRLNCFYMSVVTFPFSNIKSAILVKCWRFYIKKRPTFLTSAICVRYNCRSIHKQGAIVRNTCMKCASTWRIEPHGINYKLLNHKCKTSNHRHLDALPKAVRRLTAKSECKGYNMVLYLILVSSLIVSRLGAPFTDMD